MSELTLEVLRTAVAGLDAGFRSITRLQPLDGPGGKIFPATYSGGGYAVEKRRVADVEGNQREVECFLVDSVQSQSNRAEEALKAAVERGAVTLPLIEVDFAGVNERFRTPLPNLTSLDVPHRLADAILRDSELPDGTRFSKSGYAKAWSRSTLWNATPVFELCPTALVFGMWGSPEKPGGLGAKFERSYVSEIVAIDAQKVDVRHGVRIDPMNASKNIALKEKGDGSFQVVKDKGSRPSELNHGNIPFESKNAGIRCAYAEQSTVVSLGALRKLRFPVDGSETPERNLAARTVLAAMGLCAGVLAAESGTSLRSRCHLIPETEREWELVSRPGSERRSYFLNTDQATALLNAAIDNAKAAGLRWNEQKIVLRPTKELADLVQQSQELAAKEKGDGAAE